VVCFWFFGYSFSRQGHGFSTGSRDSKTFPLPFSRGICLPFSSPPPPNFPPVSSYRLSFRVLCSPLLRRRMFGRFRIRLITSAAELETMGSPPGGVDPCSSPLLESVSRWSEVIHRARRLFLDRNQFHSSRGSVPSHTGKPPSMGTGTQRSRSGVDSSENSPLSSSLEHLLPPPGFYPSLLAAFRNAVTLKESRALCCPQDLPRLLTCGDLLEFLCSKATYASFLFLSFIVLILLIFSF